ncbi:tRNA splicing endonuclease-like protein subunit [Rhizodiscina lignyota]|uniref:tRNA splicing endonuclease-like protein subunit n=1 Tax=Rhizodiscina lignyota TaxID=1504668 RepID=A0A9P4I992_9PEZI|nr:tRNA splicing endonuclease-like protein subunit [Rhizodiscina lignyota]
MADLDEDNPLIASSDAQDNDLSEETQDFRFLTALSSSVILDTHQKLPKRGEKDFEANATKLQASTLEASRQAMHDALNHTRFHNAKGHVVATFDPEENGAWVEKAKGVMFNTAEPRQDGALWLRPEEALYLLERGNLDIRWPASTSTASDETPTEAFDEPGIPMSLQGAYAAFVGMSEPGGLTLEEYTVYAGLKRAGYTVIRPSSAATIDNVHVAEVDKETTSSDLIARAFAAFWQLVTNMEPSHPQNRMATGPLVTPGLYRSYSDIYRLLSLIPFHNPAKSIPTINDTSETTAKDNHEELQDGSAPLDITYHVFKASTPYTKRAPPPPDFYVVVMPARSTSVPTLCQIEDLMSKVPYDPPRKESHLYPKLKQGYRRVILAVIDEGITSYIRLSDAGFGLEKIYSAPRGRGGKGGRGGRGGRGRGRGRGGRGRGS